MLKNKLNQKIQTNRKFNTYGMFVFFGVFESADNLSPVNFYFLFQRFHT